MRRPGISVVVPVLNEARRIVPLVERFVSDPRVEIIVADGGSTDGTPDLAGRAGARVVSGPRGRGAQQNAGARCARGGILLFLHVDTQLPPGALEAVMRAARPPDVAGGGFRFALDRASHGLRLVEALTNLRTRLSRAPYGDQALFVKADVFRKMRGFRELAIMEDLDFVRRMKRHGRIAILPLKATTSSRRWEANGVLRTSLVNRLAVLMWSAGVSDHRIRKTYDRLLRRGEPEPTGVALDDLA